MGDSAPARQARLVACLHRPNPLTTAGAPELSGGRARYTMSKANADDMVITRAGLWIASSNRWDSDSCGPDADHSGICLLPGQG
jgi:hypothetical protein